VQRATEAQTSQEQEAAEREKAETKVETKAGKQSERVHLQLAEFVYPVQVLAIHFLQTFEYVVLRCGLEDHAATYCFERRRSSFAPVGVATRSVQRATEAQTSQEQEAAEQETKVETKAGKQSERVHLQLAEFVYPVQVLAVHFLQTFEYAVLRCGLEDHAATYIVLLRVAQPADAATRQYLQRRQSREG
jgi:hypothetical protein